MVDDSVTLPLTDWMANHVDLIPFISIEAPTSPDLTHTRTQHIDTMSKLVHFYNYVPLAAFPEPPVFCPRRRHLSQVSLLPTHRHFFLQSEICRIQTANLRHSAKLCSSLISILEQLAETICVTIHIDFARLSQFWLTDPPFVAALCLMDSAVVADISDCDLVLTLPADSSAVLIKTASTEAALRQALLV
jgi:hypothetical protein